MRRCLHLIVVALVAGACAPTNSTGALPLEVLVALDSLQPSLALIPVDSGTVARTIDLPSLGFVPRFVAARNNLALVVGTNPTTTQGGMALVDLSAGTVTQAALSIGRVAAVTISDDQTAWIASWTSGIVTRLDLTTGSTEVISAAGGPQGLVATRGKVFAAMGNRQGCDVDPVGCGRGPSWLLQVAPGLPRDSIPISGPGNAGPITAGPDGNLYVLVAGDDFEGGEGRLDVVDPVRNVELASFARVGPVQPAWIAGDGTDRVLFASEPGGLMVFNTRERRLTLPFPNGIPLTFPTELSIDALGRIYVFERGGCSVAAPGLIRVYKSNLVESQPLHAGPCPVAGAIAEVPANDLYTP